MGWDLMDWMDWILLRSLVQLEHLAVLIIPVEFDFLRDSKPWGKVSNRLQYTGIKNFCYSQASSNLYKILAQGNALPTSQDPHGVVLHVWLVSAQLDPHPLLEEPCLP